ALIGLTFTQYVLWLCLPFTLGGPVLRSSQMPQAIVPQRQLVKSPDWWRSAAAATAKVLLGISLAMAQKAIATHWPDSHRLSAAFTAFVSGPIGFYLTAAGYFQWMELLGGASGFNLPQSFNRPIGRPNISSFWMNWNMSATYVFRDYLFFNRW